MEKTIIQINSLKQKNIITSFAICGGIASLFYIEPVSTYDLDVLIILSVENNPLNPLEEIFIWAKSNNYIFDREYIIIEGIPVQFLPVYNDLVEESVKNAVEIEYENISVPVVKAEYLMAIMISVNRKVDRERLIRFISEVKFDENFFIDILKRYNLLEKYDEFKRKYISE